MKRSNNRECFPGPRDSWDRCSQRLLLLTGPSPVTAHWVACQWNLQEIWEWAFSAPWDRWSWYAPQTVVKLMAIKGHCDWTLALAVCLYKDWIMDTTATDLQHPLNGIQGRNQKLGPHCVLWKMDKTGLRTVRYFQVKIFLSPNFCIFWYLEKC